jgi:hypothetical protein
VERELETDCLHVHVSITLNGIYDYTTVENMNSFVMRMLWLMFHEYDKLLVKNLVRNYIITNLWLIFRN